MGLASVGNDGKDIPSRQEVMQMLDSPDIGISVKRQLALEYLDYVEDEDPGACGFADEAERNGFRDYVKSLNNDWITEGDINGNNGGLSDVQDAYKEAKDEYDKSQEKGRQGDRAAVNDGAAALQNITGQSSDMNPGAPTSDDILNTGVAALKAFEIFLPLLARAVTVSGGGTAISFAEIQRLYFEQKGIPFTKFKGEADAFAAVNGAITASVNNVAGTLHASLADWDGSAADQAHAFQKQYAETTGAVADAVKAASDGLLHNIGSIGKILRDKVGWVQKYYFDKFGDVTAQDIDRLLRVAELGNGASQNDFIHCIGFMDVDSKNAYNDDWGSLDEDTIDFLVGQAKKWLKDVFCTWFEQHIKNFQAMCANTKAAVDAAWIAFSELLGKVSENPYEGLGKVPDGSRPREQDVSEQTQPKRASGHDVGVAGPGPAGPSVPQGTQPPLAETPKPVASAPAGNPVAHDPVEMAAAPEREALTAQQGANKISMEEPAQDGKMGISIDDGHGHARGYKLDFGDDKVQALPDATPEHRPRNPAPAMPVPDAPVPDVHRPGSDGKIRIEDGILKITAERPDGPCGQTVITVDDGKGEPTTYTLGEATLPQSCTPSRAEDLFEDGFESGLADGDLGVIAAAGGSSSPEADSGLGAAPGGNLALIGAERERSAVGYRVAKGLFDIGTSASRISGSLDDDNVLG